MATRTQRATLAAAAERRLPANKAAPSAGVLYKNHDEGHDRRQELRKMIDRGILERNALEVALRALKVRTQSMLIVTRRSEADHALRAMQTMRRITENIIKNPGNADFRKLKRHGKTFMRDVVEPKGALEFFVEARVSFRSLRTLTSAHTDARPCLFSLDSARRYNSLGGISLPLNPINELNDA